MFCPYCFDKALFGSMGGWDGESHLGNGSAPTFLGLGSGLGIRPTLDGIDRTDLEGLTVFRMPPVQRFDIWHLAYSGPSPPSSSAGEGWGTQPTAAFFRVYHFLASTNRKSRENSGLRQPAGPLGRLSTDHTHLPQQRFLLLTDFQISLISLGSVYQLAIFPPPR